MSAEPTVSVPADHPFARRVANGVGWLSLLATLALCAPGVVASAKAEPAQAEQSGPSCNTAERGGEETAVRLRQMMEELRAQAAQQQDPSDEVVVLDNRGFSYPALPPGTSETPGR